MKMPYLFKLFLYFILLILLINKNKNYILIKKIKQLEIEKNSIFNIITNFFK